ncbi:hypothetical protein BpHYR1_023911 [Brachionus plicatilis]|uniref:Uncharacterized protein n=1 Tax=Brachionus plicatilis TaxID=10195 RepID=A0A3M7R614_BRAPC|nr:hypothetical protein BpHYR1_023911 [Brachionus plicatilis]
MTSLDDLNSTISSTRISTSNKIPSPSPFFNIYSTITFSIIGIVLIAAMITTVLFHLISVAMT